MKFFSLTKVALLLLLFLPTTSISLYAQNNESEASFGLNFESPLSGYFYQDPLSALIQVNPVPFENGIDLDNYKLGSGDVISINITSVQPITLRNLYINPEGKVVSPIIGQLDLDGLTISEAKEVVLERVKTVFKDFEIDITLDYPRLPTVFVNGDVPYSGKLIVSPFSRVDAAIYASIELPKIDSRTNLPVTNYSNSAILDKGPYSFRNIKIIRNNTDTLTADLYAFFKAGNLEMNPVLLDGDQVMVQKLDRDSPTISVSGAVNNAIAVEYKYTDTPDMLIQLAGGLSQSANVEKLYVYRSTNSGIDKIEVEAGNWNTFALEAFDRVVIPREGAYNQNSVAHIFGEVNMPGTFPIISGSSTAKELINFAEGTTANALPTAAYLVRGSSIENQIQNNLDLESLKRTSDQLEQGFTYLDLETRNSSNKVFIDLTDEASLDDIKLFNGDQLFIPVNENTVFIFGQVNTPGYYNFSENTSVNQYIQRAGGFALSADLDRIFVLKAGNNTWYSPEKTTLESGDKIFIDRVPYDELNALRSYEIQKQQLKNQRTQLIMTGITTATGIITTLIAIGVIQN
ncbi:MAG: SLBB domain-containing protein [Balneolales bacterium]|nr:SLBB domain-containing protein [Balneolales bacterium]